MNTAHVTDDRPWSPAEVQILGEFWGKEPSKAIGERLGRSEQSVRNRARRSGLQKQKPLRAAPTPEEIADIVSKVMVHRIGIRDVANAHRRSHRTITRILVAHGYTKRTGPRSELPKPPACAKPAPESDPVPAAPEPPPLWSPPTAKDVAALPPLIVGRVKECQFPLWKHGARPPRPALMCGEPIYKMSLCKDHWAACWVRVPPREVA